MILYFHDLDTIMPDEYFLDGEENDEVVEEEEEEEEEEE